MQVSKKLSYNYLLFDNLINIYVSTFLIWQR
jgi:hypothetical protein